MRPPKHPLILILALLSTPAPAQTSHHALSVGARPPRFSDGQLQLNDQHLLGPSQAVAVGDFSGDCLPDLVVGTDEGIELFFNKREGGQHSFVMSSARLIHSMAWVQDLAVADLDANDLPHHERRGGPGSGALRPATRASPTRCRRSPPAMRASVRPSCTSVCATSTDRNTRVAAYSGQA